MTLGLVPRATECWKFQKAGRTPCGQDYPSSLETAHACSEFHASVRASRSQISYLYIIGSQKESSNCMRSENTTQWENSPFCKSLFFSCSSRSNALKGITVDIVQSIWRKYLNLLIISKRDYKQTKNEIWFFNKGQKKKPNKTTEYTVIYFSILT